MKKIRPRRALVVTSFALLVGCSSQVKVDEIAPGAQTFGKEFDGIPVRVASRQQVEVYEKQPAGNYKLVHSTELDLPDQSRLYAVGIDAAAVSDHTLGLEIDRDNTLRKVKTTTSNKVDDALTQTGSSIAGVATAVAAFEQKRQEVEAAKDKAATDAETNRETLYAAFIEAVEAALVQQSVVDNPPKTRTVAEQAAEESKLRQLKYKANLAAKHAGEPAVFNASETLPF